MFTAVALEVEEGLRLIDPGVQVLQTLLILSRLQIQSNAR